MYVKAGSICYGWPCSPRPRRQLRSYTPLRCCRTNECHAPHPQALVLGKKKILSKEDRAYLEREYQAAKEIAPSREMGLAALNRIRVESVS